MAAFGVASSKPLSQRIFEKYDTDGSGEIDVAEFHKMVRDQGIYLSQEALALAVMELDRNGDSKISYDEYKAWKQNSTFSDLDVDEDTIANRLRIADTFERFDKDRSGSLEIEELRLFHAELKELDMVTGDADTLMRKIDVDGDGAVQFSELMRYLERAFAEDAAAAPSAEVAATAAAAAAAAAASSSTPAPAVDFTRTEKAPQFAAPGSKTFTYEQLKAGAPEGVDPTCKEEYLDDSVFLELFGMDKTSFKVQPKWKKDAQKKKLSLF